MQGLYAVFATFHPRVTYSRSVKIHTSLSVCPCICMSAEQLPFVVLDVFKTTNDELLECDDN